MAYEDGSTILPDGIPTGRVYWWLWVAADPYVTATGAASSAVVRRPVQGRLICTPADNADTVLTPTQTMLRGVRTLKFDPLTGYVEGILPADSEGTGWTWTIKPEVSYVAGDGKQIPVTLPPFFVNVKAGDDINLANVAQGTLTSGVWTTKGKPGESIASLTVDSNGNLVATLTSGETLAPVPLPEIGLPSGTTDGQALVWDSATSSWKPGTVQGGSGDTTAYDFTALVTA